ncbi:MAG: response regulator transcription factor [Defluviitaleaceae bacterium]|nr:response regulator transcription factor [Defluviitaleaceae bacterium]
MSINAHQGDGYLLIVEDEPAVQANNKKILERRGYSVRQAFNLAEARAIVAKEMPRAIILDVQLPDGLGLDFLQELRKTSNVPVLLLTSLSTPQDIIRGLEAGGDDYLPKPYDLAVFLMRLSALLRRAAWVPDVLEFGSIKINMASNRAYLHGEDMGLQLKELSLLQQFMQYPEQLLTSDHLYEKVWGQKLIGQDNSLKVAVSKLRAKLDGSGYTIVASRGEGYCFERE